MLNLEAPMRPSTYTSTDIAFLMVVLLIMVSVAALGAMTSFGSYLGT